MRRSVRAEFELHYSGMLGCWGATFCCTSSFRDLRGGGEHESSWEVYIISPYFMRMAGKNEGGLGIPRPAALTFLTFVRIGDTGMCSVVDWAASQIIAVRLNYGRIGNGQLY